MLEQMLRHDVIPQAFYDWLLENGFKTAPASTKYHCAFEGGLYVHSCNVTRRLQDLTYNLDLTWQREESPLIVGMFHDLCKIDAYMQEIESFTPTGEFITRWKHDDDVLIKGHGDKSVMLLSQFMTLTEEEMLCIRYHMGAYETKDWQQFDRAIRKYPNVLYTHTADMLASKLDD